jgi:hypothetical protein
MTAPRWLGFKPANWCICSDTPRCEGAEPHLVGKGGLAEQHGGERGAGVELVVGEQPEGLERVVGQQVSLVDDEDRHTPSFGLFGG